MMVLCIGIRTRTDCDFHDADHIQTQDTSPEKRGTLIIVHALGVICYAKKKGKQRNIDSEREYMDTHTQDEKRDKRREEINRAQATDQRHWIV